MKQTLILFLCVCVVKCDSCEVSIVVLSVYIEDDTNVVLCVLKIVELVWIALKLSGHFQNPFYQK